MSSVCGCGYTESCYFHCDHSSDLCPGEAYKAENLPLGDELTEEQKTSKRATPETKHIEDILVDLGDVFYQAGKQYGNHSSNMKQRAIKETSQAIQTLIKEEVVKELEALKTANGYHEGDWMESIKQRIKELMGGK